MVAASCRYIRTRLMDIILHQRYAGFQVMSLVVPVFVHHKYSTNILTSFLQTYVSAGAQLPSLSNSSMKKSPPYRTAPAETGCGQQPIIDAQQGPLARRSRSPASPFPTLHLDGGKRCPVRSTSTDVHGHGQTIGTRITMGNHNSDLWGTQILDIFGLYNRYDITMIYHDIPSWLVSLFY